MSNSNYEIHSLYKPLYTTKKRYIGITGGRGSLKSHSVHDFALRLTYEVGHGILFSRYTMTSAHLSIIPEFKKAIERLGVESDFDIQKTYIKNIKTNSFIVFRGIKAGSGNNTGNLKSLSGVTTWIIDEMEDFIEESEFNRIDDSIRSDSVQNRIIWIMNPTTPQHFLFNKFFKNSYSFKKIEGFDIMVSTHPKLEHIHTTYHIGRKYLNKDWLEKAESWKEKAINGFDIELNIQLTLEEQERAKIFYSNNYLGSWKNKQEGTIFNNWEIGEFDESLPYIFGQDYGYDDPTTLVKVAIDKKNKLLYVQECFYLSSLDDDQIFELNYKHADNKLIIADSAAKTTIQTLRRKTTQERKSINLIPCVKKAGSVLTGIQKMQKYRIIVEKNSINLISELNNYIWLDKKSDTPIDNFNHLIDPLRYALDYLDR